MDDIDLRELAKIRLDLAIANAEEAVATLKRGNNLPAINKAVFNLDKAYRALVNAQALEEAASMIVSGALK